MYLPRDILSFNLFTTSLMRILTTILITLIVILNTSLMAQETEAPYHKIESYPEAYNLGGMVSRMLDGLGYRYHWASKDLRPEDLKYEPGNEGKNTLETLQHIYELSADALLLSEGKPFKRPRPAVEQHDYEWLRKSTLDNISKASKNFRSMSDSEIESLKVIFVSEKNKKEYPFWNFINGQLSDAIYHTGQVVSFRRSSGNPIPKGSNVFTGGI